MLRSKILSLLLVASLLGVAAVASPVHAQDKALRITYVVNGVLGDKSFFDSGERGIDKIADEFGAEVNTIELGVDPTNWESGLADAMSQTDKYDILVAGTSQMVDYMSKLAGKYPDKTYIFFDAPVAYDNKDMCTDGCKNVYSMTYAQNQGSFLAGVYAAAMTTSSLDGMNADAVIGAVGGQDIPVINDFIVGYQQGACLVNKDTQFLIQYAGGWNDPAKGKEIALAMYEQKADIVFQIAGGTGQGVFEAAKEQNKYAIGVDSDQATILMETDPDQAARILTSMQKNVDASLVRAVKMYTEKTLVLGKAENLGLAEGGVSLSVNDIYTKATPENVQKLIAAATEAVSKGDITVGSVFGDEATAAKVAKDCSTMPEMKFDMTPFMSK